MPNCALGFSSTRVPSFPTRILQASALWLSLSACVSVVPDPPEASNHSLRFVAQSSIATVDGRFAKWRIVDAHVDPADVRGSYVEIEIDVASVESGIAGRDDHLRDPDFFEVDRWPTATVRVHGVRPAPEPGHYDTLFDVRLRDVRHTLPGRFQVVGRDPLIVTGELEIDRVLFGVGAAPSGWNPLAVERQVSVRFRATLD